MFNATQISGDDADHHLLLLSGLPTGANIFKGVGSFCVQRPTCDFWSVQSETPLLTVRITRVLHTCACDGCSCKFMSVFFKIALVAKARVRTFPEFLIYAPVEHAEARFVGEGSDLCLWQVHKHVFV